MGMDWETSHFYKGANTSKPNLKYITRSWINTAKKRPRSTKESEQSICQCITEEGPLCYDLRATLGIETKSLPEVECIEMEVDVEHENRSEVMESIRENSEESMTISEGSIEELQNRVYAIKSESSDVTHEWKESGKVNMTRKGIKSKKMSAEQSTPLKVKLGFSKLGNTRAKAKFLNKWKGRVKPGKPLIPGATSDPAQRPKNQNHPLQCTINYPLMEDTGRPMQSDD